MRTSKGAPYRVAFVSDGKTFGDRDGLGTLAVARREAKAVQRWSLEQIVILDKDNQRVPWTAEKPVQDAPGIPNATYPLPMVSPETQPS